MVNKEAFGILLLLLLNLTVKSALAQVVETRVDNDAFYRFNPTDHLYTAGAELTYKFVQKERVQRALFLEYKIFTPFESESGDTVIVNQPNTAYFALGFRRRAYTGKRNFLLDYSIRIGIQGKEALGEEVQSFFHKVLPFVRDKGAYGWDEQLRTNPIIQMNFVPGWVFTTTHFASKISADFGVGTLENFTGLKVDAYAGFLGNEIYLSKSDNDYLRLHISYSAKHIFYSALDSGSILMNDPNGQINENLQNMFQSVTIGLEGQYRIVYGAFTLNYQNTRYPILPFHQFVGMTLGVFI